MNSVLRPTFPSHARTTFVVNSGDYEAGFVKSDCLSASVSSVIGGEIGSCHYPGCPRLFTVP